MLSEPMSSRLAILGGDPGFATLLEHWLSPLGWAIAYSADTSGLASSSPPPALIIMDDAASRAAGGGWVTHVRALDGPLAGQRLRPLGIIKDYWFNWKHYNPDGRLYNLGPQ